MNDNRDLSFLDETKFWIEYEKKEKPFNKDYAAALKVLDEYVDNDEAPQSISGLFAWLHERLNSQA